MIHLPGSVRVYSATSQRDMRRGFDALHALVTGAMQLDAFAGHLFVFANRRHYPTGTEPTPEQLQALRLRPYEVLPKWNYTISPNL